MKRLAFFLAAVLVYPMLAWAGGTVVGNGGGGVIDHGKLYVLDLFEAGTAQTAHFESAFTTNNGISFSQWNSEVDYDHHLLKQKLDELNDRFSGLGDLVFDAFTFFSVTYATGPLTPTCDGPCPANQVQLAIRRYRTIYLNRELWHQLDPAQKIALLIHEGIYSYANRICGASKICHQDSRSIRPIVGLLFASDRSRDVEIATWIHDRLNIQGLYIGRLDQTVDLTVSHWPQDSTSAKFRWNGPATTVNLEQKLNKFCLSGKNLEKGIIGLSLEGERLVRSVTFDPYNASFGLQWAFHGFLFKMRSSQILTAEDCEAVSKQAALWPQEWRIWQ